jgi:DNA-binding NarL/FixJ family response regulator
MRVIVAEGSALLRDVMAESLGIAVDIDVAAVLDSLATLLDACRSETPDVVITGPALTDGRVADYLADILISGARVLVICDSATSAEATALLFAGASGCLPWPDCDAAELIRATRTIAGGHAALHPAAAAAVLARWRNDRKADPSRTSGDASPARDMSFTSRERDVLNALGRGLPTKTIGRELSISPKTVESHITRVLTKLGARSRAQAIAVAHERGLLSEDQHALIEMPQ